MDTVKEDTCTLSEAAVCTSRVDPPPVALAISNQFSSEANLPRIASRENLPRVDLRMSNQSADPTPVTTPSSEEHLPLHLWMSSDQSSSGADLDDLPFIDLTAPKHSEV